MKSILILDDDEDTLFLFKHILKNNEWQVNTLPHCNDILENIEAYNPDLIIMDNSIPDEGGLAATRKIKESDTYKNIPVIFSSANFYIEDIAKSAGADAYIKKPFEITELRKQVKRLLHLSQTSPV
ncbi:MAG TPA: response regulator [Chitinophagaceae bacterium]|nr:response regulator [Chitinophagaceae bacterium]